jgi:hypothetical protein
MLRVVKFISVTAFKLIFCVLGTDTNGSNVELFTVHYKSECRLCGLLLPTFSNSISTRLYILVLGKFYAYTCTHTNKIKNLFTLFFHYTD